MDNKLKDRIKEVYKLKVKDDKENKTPYELLYDTLLITTSEKLPQMGFDAKRLEDACSGNLEFLLMCVANFTKDDSIFDTYSSSIISLLEEEQENKIKVDYVSEAHLKPIIEVRDNESITKLTIGTRTTALDTTNFLLEVMMNKSKCRKK